MKQPIILLHRFTLALTVLALLAACGSNETAGNTAINAPVNNTAVETAIEPADNTAPDASANDTAVETAVEPIVVSGAGDITAVVEQYRQLLGGVNNGGAPGQNPSGYREINWDGVPDELAAPNFMPPDFFNDTTEPRARGAFFATPGDGIQVSANKDNPYGAAPYFNHLNDSYTFKAFSEERLFSPIGSNIVDMTFFVPGTNTPATVTGFGAVYTDVDTDHTAFEYFDKEGNSLGAFATPIADAGLSFLGVVFPEPVVYRVQIRYGTVALGPDDSLRNDVAVMDNFIYGEPQALAAAGSFAGPIPGSRAFVAFVRDGQHVLAYVCDSLDTAEWFRGEVHNEVLDLTAKSGARLHATFDEAAVNGAFTPAGGLSLAFKADAVTAPAGLYRSEGAAQEVDYVGGLIILSDGSHRGLVQSGTHHFIVDPDPLDIRDGSSNLLATVNWGDGIGHLPSLSFNQVKINE